MKKLLTLTLLFLATSLLTPALASAARSEKAGGPKSPPTTEPTEMVGYDISYPQCGRRLPSDHYFAIIGVNGGLASNFNPCLSEQLQWAATARDGSNQAKVQLYVNTGNPAEEIDLYNWSNWPSSGTTPYGECDGEKANTDACSWQYGWDRSVETEAYFIKSAAEAGLLSSATKDYTWWLDVETMNSWQNSSDDALKRNVAALEGFAAYYQSRGAHVGLYSTAYQWGEITGNFVSENSNLNGLDNWRPSGASLANAKSNCNVDPLTSGGKIALTQYVRKNLDHNYSCI